VVLGGALVLLVALGVIGAVAMRKPAAPPPAAATATATAPVPAAVPPTAPPAAPRTTDAGKPSSETAQEPPPVNVSAPIAATPEPGAAPTVSVPASAAAPTAESAIRLTFTEVSWVEVLDASGKQLLSQNNPAGSEVRLDGKGPFQVLIGNASGTRLEYRGKPIELGPMTSRDNVARVKLN
jgi:cytoskeleton protein RodZ